MPEIEAGARFTIETTIRDKYGNIKSSVTEGLSEEEESFLLKKNIFKKEEEKQYGNFDK